MARAEQAFQRGLTALAQWLERKRQRPVPRGHTEWITPDGVAEAVSVRLGVWVSNTRARRDKLTQEQPAALGVTGGPARR
ncbi:helicase associated domain-containing protein [Streptomyces sp. NPDC059917]|uniref:helicase associated domain-containing protein n=1 Tax=Streptomyces sp. NPDC059917 TaxID=3347002 RepID=UPI003664A639